MGKLQRLFLWNLWSILKSALGYAGVEKPKNTTLLSCLAMKRCCHPRKQGFNERFFAENQLNREPGQGLTVGSLPLELHPVYRTDASLGWLEDRWLRKWREESPGSVGQDGW